MEDQSLRQIVGELRSAGVSPLGLCKLTAMLEYEEHLDREQALEAAKLMATGESREMALAITWRRKRFGGRTPAQPKHAPKRRS